MQVQGKNMKKPSRKRAINHRRTSGLQISKHYSRKICKKNPIIIIIIIIMLHLQRNVPVGFLEVEGGAIVSFM